MFLPMLLLYISHILLCVFFGGGGRMGTQGTLGDTGNRTFSALCKARILPTGLTSPTPNISQILKSEKILFSLLVHAEYILIHVKQYIQNILARF